MDVYLYRESVFKLAVDQITVFEMVSPSIHKILNILWYGCDDLNGDNNKFKKSVLQVKGSKHIRPHK